MRERKNIKVNVNMFDDTKLKIIDTNPNRDLINYIWFRMLTLAGKVNRDGKLFLSRNIPYTINTFAIEFNRSKEQVNIAINVLIELEMIAVDDNNVYSVINFSKHQGSKVKGKNKGEDANLKVNEDEEKDNGQGIKNEGIDVLKVNNDKSADKLRHVSNNTYVDNNTSEITSEIINSSIGENNTKGFKIEEKEKNKIKKSNLENINEYLHKENSSESNIKKRRNKKRRKNDSNIESIDFEDDNNEEIITFYDGEGPKIDGEVVKAWNFY